MQCLRDASPGSQTAFEPASPAPADHWVADADPLAPPDPMDDVDSAAYAAASRFCRAARRVRAAYAHDPMAMHQRLRHLRVPKSPGAGTATIEDPRPAASEGPTTTHAVECRVLATTDADDELPESSRSSSMLTRLRDSFASLAASTEAKQSRAAGGGHDPEASFAALVAEKLEEHPVLRYSQRLALLREATRRGIHRFEANLIIASVQHRLGHGHRGFTPYRPHRSLAGVLTFLAVQCTIVYGVWRMVHG